MRGGLGVAINESAAIHADIPESIGPLEERELNEALALSLAAQPHHTARDDDSRPAVVHRKAPPTAPPRCSAPAPDSTTPSTRHSPRSIRKPPRAGSSDRL